MSKRAFRRPGAIVVSSSFAQFDLVTNRSRSLAKFGSVRHGLVQFTVAALQATGRGKTAKSREVSRTAMHRASARSAAVIHQRDDGRGLEIGISNSPILHH
jgi:hypothetical protein